MTMYPIKNISQETLDRLVDGELDEVRRREVIESLGGDNEGWERCALAFLESQSFGQEMQRVYRDDQCAETTRTNPSFTVKRPPNANHQFNFGWWLTTVACVVFAFALGTRLQPHPATPNNPSPAVVESMPSDGTQHQLVGYPPANIWRGESIVPRDIESTLNRLGHRVDRQKGLMPMLSADGNQLLVPYEDVRIQPARDAPQ